MAAPYPGMVALGEVPRAPASVRAVVEVGSAPALAEALGRLGAALPPSALAVELRVNYATVSDPEDCARVHRAFGANRPEIETWIPLCVPGEAAPALRAAMSPNDCAACLFLEAGRCPGLGDRARSWTIGGAGGPAGGEPALAALDPGLLVSASAFDGRRPAAYWLPTRAQIARIGAAVRGVGGRRLWDLGGGNGFVAALLARDEGLEVVVVDRVAWEPSPGIQRVRCLLPELPALPPPDAVLISWPPHGEGFADALRRLEPKATVHARDRAGLCGRQADCVGLAVDERDLTWFGWPEDDGAATDLPLRHREVVRALADHRRGGPSTGLLEIRAATPLVAPPSPIEAAPYPWEKPAGKGAGQG